MVGSVISPSGARKPGGISGATVPSGSVVLIESTPHSVKANMRRYFDASAFILFGFSIGLEYNLEI